jgi:hypothetical protein
MLALLLASAIGTTMAELARLELVLARQRKATAAALAGVDACVESVVGSLPAGWDFAELLNGSDGVAGTADDGLVPLAVDCTGMGRAAPGAPDPPRFLLEVEAMRRGGRRRLEAVVRRHAEPGIPALLWVADAAAIGRVGGTLALDGGDIAGSRPPVSMLAAPADPPLLDSWVAAQGGALVAASGTQAPMWSPPPPLPELAARATAGGALAPGAGLVGSPPAVPGVTLSPGDLTVTSPSFGAGVLVVDGLLRIAAPLTFTGVVAATGGLYVEATGLLDLQGALWLGPGALEALVVEGSASVVASAAGLAAADALLPLPRRARLASVRDF